MSSDEQQLLDTIAALQLKGGGDCILRERILVAVLPPPADPKRRDELKNKLDDLVPSLLTRHPSSGALPPSYSLAREGWLRSGTAPGVLRVVDAFLWALREHVISGVTTQRLEWHDLKAQGLVDSDYHLACIVAKAFHLQAGGSTQSWDGKNTPTGSFNLPIDTDELLDVVDPEQLVSKRRLIPYERLLIRKVIVGELTGHVRNAVEHIYKEFARIGAWPLSRTLHVQLVEKRIALERIASGRFARGHDIHTEGARTTLTLAGLLIPQEAKDDRDSVVLVLRFLGEYSRAHPETRTLDARSVANRTGVDEIKIVRVAKLLQSQWSNYATTTVTVDQLQFYLDPAFIPNAVATDLWDVVLNEEEHKHRWQASTLDGLPLVLGEDEPKLTDKLIDNVLSVEVDARISPDYSAFGTTQRTLRISIKKQVADDTLYKIIARDVDDAVTCLEQGRYKLAAILAGAIVEATLLGRLAGETDADLEAAFRAAYPHHGPSRAVPDREDLRLAQLIAVAEKRGKLKDHKLYDGVRDWRNFVHPKLEATRGSIDITAAQIAVAAAVRLLLRKS